ncbi:MAG: MFS transporter [Acidobacteria bacterium]|nr:MFS transporter [Acidobacteriota bacterium]
MIEKLAGRFAKIEPGEGPGLFWAGAYFFSILASYYCVRPLRDELGIQSGLDTIQLLYLGTLTGTILVNLAYGWLVTKYARRVFVPVVYRGLTAILVIFYLLLKVIPGVDHVIVGRAFFVFTSVLNVFSISVFWGFMADLFREEQGRRLFGLIGAGGTLGGVVGSFLAGRIAKTLGPIALVVVSALLLELAVFAISRLVRIFRVDVGAEERKALEPEGSGKPVGHDPWEGARRVVTSPYLLGICLFLALYSISSTFMYFEQARIVKATFTSSAERTAFFAKMDLWVNSLTLLAQLFLTGRIILSLGVSAALSLLPALTMSTFAALAAAPSATVLLVMQVLRRVSEFGVVRPAREVLFTVVSREEKYAAKAVIDTFVYRASDVVGSVIDKVISSSGLGFPTLAMLFAPISALWLLDAWWLGRQQKKRAAALGSAPAPA